MSLSAAIVDTAVKHAAGRRVTRVNVTVGALRQVVPPSLAFYFEIVARGTPCEGARLEQTIVPARARCEGCRRAWELDSSGFGFRCEGCGRPGEVMSGEELEVESIEVEEDACIAPR